ncbi:hypothetical protein F2Q69_00035339 [Brassica cretica]|uniref:Uncharacterized protein n=1 Tax=Brassica cretica TaxID=69181 RepID=A0A8S9SK98_BRACR|nr:hypothetical protein F2Q69_00035339 [Brassica cretica]
MINAAFYSLMLHIQNTRGTIRNREQLFPHLVHMRMIKGGKQNQVLIGTTSGVRPHHNMLPPPSLPHHLLMYIKKNLSFVSLYMVMEKEMNSSDTNHWEGRARSWYQLLKKWEIGEKMPYLEDFLRYNKAEQSDDCSPQGTVRVIVPDI